MENSDMIHLSSSVLIPSYHMLVVFLVPIPAGLIKKMFGSNKGIKLWPLQFYFHLKREC